jgi:hypothetical protein
VRAESLASAARRVRERGADQRSSSKLKRAAEVWLKHDDGSKSVFSTSGRFLEPSGAAVAWPYTKRRSTT